MRSSMQTFTVSKFTGINEAVDGYTELKMGEASRMENFLITDGFNLTTRPGIRRVELAVREPASILGVWTGHVHNEAYLVVADFAGGKDRLWMYRREDGQYTLACSQEGALGLNEAEDAMVKMFSFGGEFYVMSKAKTVVFTQEGFREARGYVPLVITGASPAGGGTQLENINLLSPYRRMDFSADGEAKDYVLPEEAVEVVSVTIDNEEKELPAAGSYDRESHTFTFAQAPVKGVGNVEITYAADEEEAERNRLKIAACPLVESYNGSTDTRLFVAGDGSNICYYSGVPQDGVGSALYFPAMNEVKVDMSASPITGLQRHYGKLLVFKPDGTYTITYEPVTLVDGNTIAGFFLRSASREFGNEAPGQVCTVNNFPRTVTKSGIYEWRITSSYYRDERYAKRVSDPVQRSLAAAEVGKIITCDDDHSKTYYVFLNDELGTVLVNRYALSDKGVWCVYRSNLCRNVRYARMHGKTMVFSTDTELFWFDESATVDAPMVPGDEAQNIRALWESGYMDFGSDCRRKYSSHIYVSMLPEASSALTITASTDRREVYREKSLSSTLFSFENLDFERFSFDLNDTPKIRRVRLKVKKFVYYKLIFKVEDLGAQATILSVDQQVRFSAMAK